MSKYIVLLIAVSIVFTPASASAARKATSSGQLSLVSARNYIPGSFTTTHSMHVDSERIYLASTQGILFVVARNAAANFPLLSQTQVASSLTSVNGDSTNLYITSTDGYLRVYTKTDQPQFVREVQVSTTGIRSTVLVGSNLVVATGQASLAATTSYVFLSQLNPGDVAVEITKSDLSVVRTYGQEYTEASTVVFNKKTGAALRTLPNNSLNQVALTVIDNTLYRTEPGCCAVSYTQTQLKSWASTTISSYYTNVIAQKSDTLITGTESGRVIAYKGSSIPVSNISLREMTGHTGSEDIEIRALYADSIDGYIFAASSWGNDTSRTPELPSLFILELQ